MKLDYLDLVLIHQPLNDYYGTYRAMEDLYKEGKIKAIGVSNFYPDRLVDLALFNEVTPAVNQIEINPFHQQLMAQDYNIDVFDFELNEDDMNKISALDKKESSFFNHQEASSVEMLASLIR